MKLHLSEAECEAAAEQFAEAYRAQLGLPPLPEPEPEPELEP